WQETTVQNRIATWARAACGWAEAQTLSVARFGDNMREVAVTEGDKVDAEIRFGFAANGYGVGDLVAALPDARSPSVMALLDEYADSYRLADELQAGGTCRESLVQAARIELALRSFLDSHDC